MVPFHKGMMALHPTVNERLVGEIKKKSAIVAFLKRRASLRARYTIRDPMSLFKLGPQMIYGDLMPALRA